ncbi:MAG: single-stranded DNA-binding protein [Bifidobacteriaceae bacterium]|jgi:single-strand DNA-binding protein|nr:single-stranded DNA-binding protein [Bifidobacteriaceae bacterium]
MANDTYLTIVGNLTADPEYRVLGDGNVPNVQFSIVSTPRTFNRQTSQWEDGEPLYIDCFAWRQLAENINDSLKKGVQVIARGRLERQKWQTQEGENRYTMKLRVDEIGPNLIYQTASVAKSARQGDSVFPNQLGNNQSQTSSTPAVNPSQNPSFLNGAGTQINSTSAVNPSQNPSFPSATEPSTNLGQTNSLPVANPFDASETQQVNEVQEVKTDNYSRVNISTPKASDNNEWTASEENKDSEVFNLDDGNPF